MDKQKEMTMLIGQAIDCCKRIQSLLEFVDVRLSKKVK
jgi:hypothetical protein